MRGEYTNLLASTTHPLELPPRARRILDEKVSAIQDKGTTSACAENTFACSARVVSPWNYLRVRGEYNPARSTSQSEMELPPRARRIQSCQVNIPIGNGTTSACAENTEWCVMHIENERNYLRVRGEYRCWQVRSCSANGTTSACAENTACPHHGFRYCGNYLRVRGEYANSNSILS